MSDDINWLFKTLKRMSDLMEKAGIKVPYGRVFNKEWEKNINPPAELTEKDLENALTDMKAMKEKRSKNEKRNYI